MTTTDNWYVTIDLNKIPKKYLDIIKKRFQNEHMLITELYTTNSYNVYLFLKDCKNILDIYNKVLTSILYPLDIFGDPTDCAFYEYGIYLDDIPLVYLYNTVDFWKTAHETIRDRYGDCEDTSALLHTLFLINGIETYHVFGQVYYDNQLLGGHSWVIAKVEDKYKLFETTFDKPIQSLDILPDYDFSSPYIEFGKYTYYIIMMIKNKEQLIINKQFYNKFNINYQRFADYTITDFIDIEVYRLKKFAKSKKSLSEFSL